MGYRINIEKKQTKYL